MRSEESMIEIDELLKLLNDGVQARAFEQIEAIKILVIMHDANELMYSNGCKTSLLLSSSSLFFLSGNLEILRLILSFMFLKQQSSKSDPPTHVQRLAKQSTFVLPCPPSRSHLPLLHSFFSSFFCFVFQALMCFFF